MPLTLAEISERLGADLHGLPDVVVDRVAALGQAGPGSISFLANRRYRPQLKSTRASAVILDAEMADACPVATLVMDNPYVGYARVARWLNPVEPWQAGRHPTSHVDAGAVVAESVHLGAFSYVSAGAVVEHGCYVGPGCVLESGVRLGAGCHLSARVTLCASVRLGRRVLVHPGAVIGADGFGIANDGGRWEKVPQLGSVRVGNDVEIGANTTIDRGALEDTVIEDGVKLDNLIQIAHNVHIGEHSAVAACVAIGGSARIGKRCTIAGAASLAGHLEIADDVHLTATSAVANSIREPGVYSSGMPVQDNRSWRRNIIRMRQLDDMAKNIRRLMKRMAILESRGDD